MFFLGEDVRLFAGETQSIDGFPAPKGVVNAGDGLAGCGSKRLSNSSANMHFIKYDLN
jgi:hypothetical protein